LFSRLKGHPFPRLTRLTVRLSVDHCRAEPEAGELIWSGEIVSLGFSVSPAEPLTEGAVLFGTTRVEVEGLRIGTVTFNVTVGAATGSGFAIGRAVRSGFISYAGHDRWLDLGRVQGLEKAGIEVFMDVHGLRADSD
jgi:hypothetical protein